MEQQIQDLVDSIRKEGLDEANRQRDEIIAEARKEADRIIREARENASKMVDDATKECELRRESTKASLSQACRDAALALKDEINRQLSTVLEEGVSSCLDSALVSRLVLQIVDAGFKDSEIQIATADAEALVKQVRGSLASKLKNGLELKTGKGFEGIRLVSKDGSGYIDLSVEELVSMLKPHLSMAVREQIF